MTEDYTPSIHIEPPPDSVEQDLFASLGAFDNFDNYGPTSQSGMNDCYPPVPALFIQGSESPSVSKFSTSDGLYLHTDYRYNPSGSNSGRSSPIDAYSPASSFSGDIFPDDLSSDDFAPHWSQHSQQFSGHSSPALSPSLSPLTSAFDGFALDERYPAGDQSVLSSGPAIQRLRSSSHSVQSVSPADVWANGVGRGRSSSFSGPTNNDNQFYRNDLVVPQQNFTQYEYSDSTEVQISVANADPFPNSLGTAMSWGPAQTDMHRNANAPNDNNNTMSTPGNLVAGWRYPGSDERPSADSHSDRPPPSPSHLAVPVVGLQRRGACASRRSRSHSDLSAFMPDEDTGRGRGQHRTALSIPNSRSVSNGSRAASPHGAIHFNVQTPAMYSPSAPSSPAFEDAEPGDDHCVSIGRRRTFTAIRGPDEKLLRPASTLTRASSAPTKGRRSKPIPTPGMGLGVFKAEQTDSSFLSSQGSDPAQAPSQQEFRISQPSPGPSFKREVASKKIRLASDARRINVAAFTCPLPGCPSTFTARHNLINHINSHNKHRPHRCMCGMSFTTQGVLNRHKKRCRKEL